MRYWIFALVLFFSVVAMAQNAIYLWVDDKNVMQASEKSPAKGNKNTTKSNDDKTSQTDKLQSETATQSIQDKTAKPVTNH